MPATTILDALKSGKILTADGAWGTMLHKKGLAPGDCPEVWNLERFGEVKGVAEGYVAAGAEIVKTNSFGANRFRLAHFGFADNTALINRQAARASREAAGGGVWVMASVGPTGKLLIAEDVTAEELYEAFVEQVTALEEGGADAVCVETMSDVGEAKAAIKAAKENTRLQVFCTFSFDKTPRGEFRTMMGVSPGEAALACIAAGADVVGTNCGNGIELMVEITKEIKAAAPEALLLVQANAGLPRRENGLDVFPDTPGYMAGFVRALLDAGANIIGGCCGTTPEHIAAIKAAVHGSRS